MKNALKLNDETIGQIAKLIQIAILTGTDIIDNLRTLQIVAEDGELYLTPEYKKIFENNLNLMLNELEENNGNDNSNSSTNASGQTQTFSLNQQQFEFMKE